MSIRLGALASAENDGTRWRPDWREAAMILARAYGVRDNRVMGQVTGDELRAVINGLVAGVCPHDAREAADQAGILEWIASGQPLFRTVPPATPPRHLVSYFALVDSASRMVLLGDHVKSGLWLPSGGHVEDGEDPRDTVDREASEELGIRARFHEQLGAGMPFFLTATPTLGAHSHVDVSLWFVLACDRDADLEPDPREYRAVRWLPLDGQDGWPASRFDPEMGRFARKVTTVLGG
ncbi:MAG TPA: NUDIX domain-containing protein [Trebonia sp.]|nr:NUDIX domain-containing protein [Trebonia sp.]